MMSCELSGMGYKDILLIASINIFNLTPDISRTHPSNII